MILATPHYEAITAAFAADGYSFGNRAEDGVVERQSIPCPYGHPDEHIVVWVVLIDCHINGVAYAAGDRITWDK